MQKISFLPEELLALNSAIWKAKKDKQLSLKADVPSVTLPEHFKTIEADLVAAHHLKKITYAREVVLTL